MTKDLINKNTPTLLVACDSTGTWQIIGATDQVLKPSHYRKWQDHVKVQMDMEETAHDPVTVTVIKLGDI